MDVRKAISRFYFVLDKVSKWHYTNLVFTKDRRAVRVTALSLKRIRNYLVTWYGDGAVECTSDLE